MTDLAPYPAYVDVCVDFLDQIPSSWAMRPAVTLAKVLTSTVDKHTVEGEVPIRLCNYTDVYYNDVIRDDPTYMTATATLDQIASYSVEAGDVVFTKDSETADDIGIGAYVKSTLPGVVYGYHLATYRPRDHRYGKFLKWVLDSKYVKATFQTRTLGVTRVGLSQNTVRYLRVPTPPPAEAELIGEFLDRETAEIDAFIADQEELIGLLIERRAGALLTSALSSPRKLHGTLGRFLKKEARPNLGSEVVTVFRDGEVTARSNRREGGFTMSEFDSGYQGVLEGDLVFHGLDGFAGAVGLSASTGRCSPVYHVCTVTAAVDATFMALYLRALGASGFLQAHAWSVRQRSVDYRNWAVFSKLPIELPPIAEQRKLVETIMATFEEIDAAITDAKEAIALSRERRAALISAAVTGKIDVREHGSAA